MWVAWEQRRKLRPSSGRMSVAAGFALWGGSLAASLLCRAPGDYICRLAPLGAGLGLALMVSRLDGLGQHARAFVLLGVTLLDPLPPAIRDSGVPSLVTAAAVAPLLRLVAVPVVREGPTLYLGMSGMTLEVDGTCAGLGVIAELLVLAVLVLCLFASSRSQKLLVIGTAVVVGFAVNALRVFLLALVASHRPEAFVYWHGHALEFPVMAAAVGSVAWWLILRKPREADGLPAGPSVRDPV